MGFAPIVCARRYSDFADCIEDINKSPYGLHIGLFTRDLRKAFYAYENVVAGGVLVGEMPNFRIDSHPYGGVGDSGIGREGVKSAMLDYTEEKVLIMKDANKL